jgi:predicted RNA-binding protein with PIN domain
MALLIDGYNLLNVTSIFGKAGPGTELHRTRLAFLNFLATSFTKRERGTTTIVFDAAGAPPGLPQTITHDGMTIHFAQRYSDADELIEELLESHRAPRSLTVVSSDHRVQRAARHRGATFIDSEVWYAELRTRKRVEAADDESASKPTATPSDELNYWIAQFGGSATAEKVPDEIFPPGYGDDLTESD